MEKQNIASDLIVSIEVFKDNASIWLNQGNMQIKIALPLEECVNFANWLLIEDEESWPCIGLPLPGSKQIDYFKPENKKVAEIAFGFSGEFMQAFKFIDLEYNAKSLELKFGQNLEFSFLDNALISWIEAARQIIQYHEN